MKAVNLLPSEHRGPARSPAAASASPSGEGTPFGAYVLLGILACAVAATALLVLAGNTVKDRRVELKRVTADATATQAKAAALQSFADFDSLATQRVATVKGLAASRFDWERSLSDLARALPADVHLRGITGSTTTAGTATGSIQAPSIQLTGCTSSQVSVANLMSRLRNVRGVTRVSLTDSAEAAPSVTAPSVPSAQGQDRPAQLCPKGSPPDFDVTTYFERAALPPAAAVNPGAASATAATAAATPAAGSTPAAGATPAATATTTTTTASTQGGTP